MPAAGQWLRGVDTPLAPSTATNSSAQNSSASEWVRDQNTPLSAAGNGQRKPFASPKNQGLKIRRPQVAPGGGGIRGGVAQAGTWTPAQGKLNPPSAPDPHRASKPSQKPTPPKTSARCPVTKEDEREQEIKRKEKTAAALRKKREALEAVKDTERAMEIHSKREALKQAQEAVQADCSLMESSVKLREKRKLYEVEHKHEIAAKERDDARKQRRGHEEEEQRKVIRRILKAHASHYDVLMIPESSSLDSINKARKELSRLVHPDRCKLPGAQEAFVKITESASALQTTAG